LTGKFTAYDSPANKSTLEKFPDLEPFLCSERDRVVKVLGDIRKLGTRDRTRSLFLIAQAVFQRYDTAKRAARLVDFDDIIAKMLGLLSRSSSADWVCYKLDGGIDHVLVDEAQDTSPDQWKIIEELTRDWFDGHSARDPSEGRTRLPARTVFAVGDDKQSIYSFQGADPASFARMRESFGERIIDAGQEFRPLQFNATFRSTPAVLRAVNAVFSPETVWKSLCFDGEWIEHQAVRDHPGLVELWEPVEEANADHPDAFDAPLDREAEASPKAKVAAAVAAKIKHLVEAGVTRHDGKPLTAGDMLILVRTRSAFVTHMARALKRLGIPVAGKDRLKLLDDVAVSDLLALGAFILQPADDLSLAVVLRSPLIGIEEMQLFDIAHAREGRLWDGLRQHQASASQEAVKRLARWRRLAAVMRPFEFYTAVLNTGAGASGSEGETVRQAFLRRLGPDAVEPLEVFFDRALEFEAKAVPTLTGFLQWIAAGDVEVKREQEDAGDAVRIMTVHGAKGLEAPVVFLPDTCNEPRFGADPIVGDESANGGYALWRASADERDEQSAELSETHKKAQIDELRRQLYVAMTRAEDRLYIGGYAGKSGLKENAWYRLIKAALEPLTEETDCPVIGPVRRLEDPAPQNEKVASDPPPPEAEEPRTLDAPWLFRPAAFEPPPPAPL
ncbi:MAG: 3'-5' exonuclease, partial [Pseudomonadota bacterium]